MSIIVVDIETIPNQENRERIESTNYRTLAEETIKNAGYKTQITIDKHMAAITDESVDAAKTADIKHCSLRWNEGQIIAITAHRISDSFAFSMCANEWTENYLLNAFTEFLEEEATDQDVFCGKNVDGFDLPWLVCKLMCDHIPVHKSLLNRPVELNKVLFGWSSGSIQKVGLDVLGELLGKPKSAHGSQVYQMWKDGMHEEILKYNYQDVAICVDIVKRLGL